MDFLQLSRFLNQRVPIIYYKQYLSLFVSDELQQRICTLINDISIYNRYYCKLFLKQYIMVLESDNQEVNEELYQLYCLDSILNSVELSINDFDILSYSFKCNDTLLSVKIQENPKVISGHNTTGLRTWEAAVYLSNYLLQNEHLVQNSSVLELGAGTGLVSISLLKSKVPSSVTITDGSPNLFDNLNASLNLNNLAGNDNLKCHQYLWGHQETEWALPQVDYLVGADITYDSSILEDLLTTILDFFRHGTKAAFIAATVRNESTVIDWENVLTKSFHWKVIDECAMPELLNTNYWYKPGTPEIKIYKISNQVTTNPIGLEQ